MTILDQLHDKLLQLMQTEVFLQYSPSISWVITEKSSISHNFRMAEGITKHSNDIHCQINQDCGDSHSILFCGKVEEWEVMREKIKPPFAYVPKQTRIPLIKCDDEIEQLLLNL